MALDNFSNLTARIRSKTISDIFELIKYYGQSYSFRPRADLTKLSLDENRPICWTSDHTGKVGGVVIADKKYNLEVDGIKLQLIGHIIANARISIQSLIAKTIDKHKNSSFIMLCNSQMAEALELKELGLVEIDVYNLGSIWNSVANLKTDYFNVEENLVDSLRRKRLNVYYYLAPKDYLTLQTKNKLPKMDEFSKAEIV